MESPNEFIAPQLRLFCRHNPTQRKVVQSSREIAASFCCTTPARQRNSNELCGRAFNGDSYKIVCLASGDFKLQSVPKQRCATNGGNGKVPGKFCPEISFWRQQLLSTARRTFAICSIILIGENNFMKDFSSISGSRGCSQLIMKNFPPSLRFHLENVFIGTKKRFRSNYVCSFKETILERHFLSAPIQRREKTKKILVNIVGS